MACLRTCWACWAAKPSSAVGIGIGLTKTSASRYAEEYFPLALYGTGNACIQFFANAGTFELSFFSYLYPTVSDPITTQQ